MGKITSKQQVIGSNPIRFTKAQHKLRFFRLNNPSGSGFPRFYYIKAYQSISTQMVPYSVSYPVSYLYRIPNETIRVVNL
ncbi:hypothetical protein SAMN05661012_00364 [Chitinophaga sancti]|uniref:Uncharacterized protein n=1 Tax=Chitinophaga sancti TaxID=1004 RepID=A0A1K1M185_9BACT|nr:hypothetical protein SAMN05661012_00364 [Chitinophaga sancti]